MPCRGSNCPPFSVRQENAGCLQEIPGFNCSRFNNLGLPAVDHVMASHPCSLVASGCRLQEMAIIAFGEPQNGASTGEGGWKGCHDSDSHKLLCLSLFTVSISSLEPLMGCRHRKNFLSGICLLDVIFCLMMSLLACTTNTGPSMIYTDYST